MVHAGRFYAHRTDGVNSATGRRVVLYFRTGRLYGRRYVHVEFGRLALGATA